MTSSFQPSIHSLIRLENYHLSDASGETGFYTGPATLASSSSIATSEDAPITSSTSTTNPPSNNGVGLIPQSSGASSLILLPHGPDGDFRYDEGRRYVGSWESGHWHGMGRASWPHGNTYEGQYDHDQRHGFGIYRWNDGRWYEGNFQHDVRHGKGKYMTFSSSIKSTSPLTSLVRNSSGGTMNKNNNFNNVEPDCCYEGDFQQGQPHGEVTHLFPGGKYVGSFERGLYHGYGVCTWDNGRVYKGEWKNGMAHGTGIETNESGRVIHDGMWQNDEPVDKVRQKSTNSFFSTPSLANIMNIPATNIVAAPLISQTGNKAIEESSSTKFPVTNPSHEFISVAEQDQLQPVVNVRLHDALGRKGTFRGMILNDVPHSVGHMIYSDAISDVLTYQGFWEYGDWNQGRVEYRNGDTFHGDWSHDIRVGTGTYVWKDGRRYDGEWKSDRREGQGTFYYPNGDKFEGNFRNNKRQGLGRFQFNDGSLFEGGFDRGEFHGPGCKYVHRDGRIYIGDFVRGLRSGYGKEIYPDGSLRYEGEWIEDEPLHSNKIKPPPKGFVLLEPEDDANKALEVSKNNHQKSHSDSIPAILVETKDCTTVVAQIVKDALGNEGTYTGLVRSGLPHGVGRMVYVSEIREGFWRDGRLEGHARAFFRNGDFYEGHFVRSQREGKGVYKWTDGRIYEGDYSNDQRHGMGRFVYPSGDEYVGEYYQGQRQGQGKFTFADGSSYNGGWLESVYHGYGELKEVNGSTYKGEWQGGLRHGKGEQQIVGDENCLIGQWVEDRFVEQLHVISAPSRQAEIPKTVPYPGEGVTRQEINRNDQSTSSNSDVKSLLNWGSLDGENSRWNANSQELEMNGMLATTTTKLTSSSVSTSSKQVTSANVSNEIKGELVSSIDMTMKSTSVVAPVITEKENVEEQISTGSNSASVPVAAPTNSAFEVNGNSGDNNCNETNSTNITLPDPIVTVADVRNNNNEVITRSDDSPTVTAPIVTAADLSNNNNDDTLSDDSPTVTAPIVTATDVRNNNNGDTRSDNNLTATAPIVTAEVTAGNMNGVNNDDNVIDNKHTSINAEMSLVAKVDKISISVTNPVSMNPTGSLMTFPIDDGKISAQNVYSTKVTKHPTKFVKTPPNDDE